MNTAEFINLVLTPIGGGIGAMIAFSVVLKQQPNRPAAVSSWPVRLGIGVAVAGILFAYKLF